MLIDGQINPEFQPGQAAANVTIVRDADDTRMLEVVRQIYGSDRFEEGEQIVNDLLQRELMNREADLAILIPEKMNIGETSNAGDGASEFQKLFVFHNSAHDKSTMAAEKFGKVITRWQRQITFRFLEKRDVEIESLSSVQPVYADVADTQKKQAATWSKILPFIILIWSLTGAFYPACLLYTSPSPRDKRQSRMPSSA